MAESAKRRSCFHQSLNLDGLGFSWQPFWWLRCNYCEDQATVVILMILIKFFDRQGRGGLPQGEDEVLRLQTSPWRQGVGGEDLYLVKHGVDDHVDVDSDDHMMMLAIEAFAKFSVGVRLVWQKSQQWFSRSFIDLQNVLQLQDWSAKVFERLTLKVLLTVFECLKGNIPRSI